MTVSAPLIEILDSSIWLQDKIHFSILRLSMNIVTGGCEYSAVDTHNYNH